MHYNMNYVYDLQGTKLAHRPAKGHTDFKPPKQKAAPHKRGLDPEDLTRRLQFVIAERKAIDAEKRRSRTVPSSSSRPFPTQEPSEVKSLRRRAVVLDSPQDKRRAKGTDRHSENSLAARFRRRASKATLDEQQIPADAAASDGPYIPRVAASQFADTTLGESPPDKSQVHRLSRAALKYHMDGINADFQVASTAVPSTAPIKQAQAMRRAQTLREKNYDRNQFRASSMPDNLEPVITSPTLSKRRSVYTAHTSEEKQPRASRRKSTGSFLGGDSSSSPRQSMLAPPLNPTDLAAVVEAHRVDWTQSDEATATPPPRPKSSSPAQSTKGESRWKFRSRLNSFHRNKEEKTLSPPTDRLELPKSPIAALFARFRR